jgi:hypothetical protein
VKTLCYVTDALNNFQAERNCKYNGMKLANSTEYVTQTEAFAWAEAPVVGGFIWTGGRVGQSCNGVASNGAKYVSVNTTCCPFKNSFCEYNSELQSSFT